MKNRKIDLMLSIAGSDNTSGAGVQADIKTCQTLKSYCLNTLTAITSQNSKRVYKIVELPNEIVKSQIITVLDEYKVDSIKIGLVKSIRQAELIYNILKKKKLLVPIVVDPIYKSSTNTIFNNKKDYTKIYKILSKLNPVFTPNLFELRTLLDLSKENKFNILELIKIFYKTYKSPIVVTDGGEKRDFCEDFFIDEKKCIQKYSSKKIISKSTHGTGCSFSTALAVYLGRGFSLKKSIGLSKRSIKNFISKAPDFNLQYGPMGHWL